MILQSVSQSVLRGNTTAQGNLSDFVYLQQPWVVRVQISDGASIAVVQNGPVPTLEEGGGGA